MMTQANRTLRITPSDEGVLGVVAAATNPGAGGVQHLTRPLGRAGTRAMNC